MTVILTIFMTANKNISTEGTLRYFPEDTIVDKSALKWPGAIRQQVVTNPNLTLIFEAIMHLQVSVN